jgi:Lrp/AsnC family transcriptional regulator
MTGKYDFMLKVVVADMQVFDVFYESSVDGINLFDVKSSFTIKKISILTPQSYKIIFIRLPV